MFAQADAGLSLRRLGCALESRGVLPPYHARTGKTAWHPDTVRDILPNRCYIGEGVANRIKVEKVRGRGLVATVRDVAEPGEYAPDKAVRLPPGVFPEVIEREQFERVQARLAQRRENRAESQRWDRDPELGLLRRGMVRCPHCRTALTVNPQSNGGAQYRHDQKARHLHGCPFVAIKIDTLDAQVWAWVEAITSEPERAARLFDRLRADDGELSVAATVATFDRRIAAIEAEQATLAENMGRVTGALFDTLAGKWTLLAEERQRLDAERGEWLDRLGDMAERRERIARMVETCEGVRARIGDMTFAEKRQALHDLGLTVWLHPDGSDNRWTADFAFDLDGQGMRRAWATSFAYLEFGPDGTVDDHSEFDLSNVSDKGCTTRQVTAALRLDMLNVSGSSRSSRLPGR